MALLSLQLSPSPHPHLSLPVHRPSPNKPTFSVHFSSSSSPSVSNGRNRGRERNFLFNRHISSVTTPSSGSATAITEDEAAEEVVENEGGARTRLYAQNIPWTYTAEDIRSLFERHGTVVDVELSMYNSTRNRGLAFVTMASEEEAFAALNNLNSYDLEGRVIKVEFARSLKKNPPAPAIPTPRYNVFVGNLTWRVRSQDLRELFESIGKVLSAEVIFQTNPRRSAGYGFVSFASREDAEAAISTLNRKRFMGRPIRLVLKESQDDDDAERRSYEGEQSDVASSGMNSNQELSNQDDEK